MQCIEVKVYVNDKRITLFSQLDWGYGMPILLNYSFNGCPTLVEISTQWPDEKPTQVFDRSVLPSAPRAAPDVDRSRLPSKPPYTVYLGNLSFECSEDDIMRFFERKNLNVSVFLHGL